MYVKDTGTEKGPGFLGRTNVWHNFSTSPEATVKVLRDVYKAHINWDENALEFITEQDMMLFVLKWS